ncbi:MAG: hypothetical protein ACYS22_21700, partial [Planctomycetota bacterium]
IVHFFSSSSAPPTLLDYLVRVAATTGKLDLGAVLRCPYRGHPFLPWQPRFSATRFHWAVLRYYAGIARAVARRCLRRLNG